MANASPELVRTLWNSLVAQRSSSREAVERDWREDVPPPSLVELRHQLRIRLGRAFERRWKGARIESARDLDAALSVSEPLFVERLDELRETVEKLDAMRPEAFRWTTREEGVPKEGQRVIYYFSVVGAHPGRYAGREETEGPGGWDVFVGDFGGFLGGDVTHWMLRP